MALDLKLKFIDVDFDNQTYVLQDFTGMESSSNPGGYGWGTWQGLSPVSVNPSKVNVDVEITDFEIKITKPDSTISTIDINSLEYITATQVPIPSIVNISIDNGAKIENGLYTFELIVKDGVTELASVSITKYLYDLEELKRKINSKFIEKVDFCKIDCECNKGLITLWSYYKALEAAIEQENNIQIAYLSEQIELLV